MTGPLDAAPLPDEHWAEAFDATETIEEAVGQAIGAASMCWENPAGAGVFDSITASTIAETLYRHIQLRWSNDRDGVSAHLPAPDGVCGKAAAWPLSSGFVMASSDGRLFRDGALTELEDVEGDAYALLAAVAWARRTS